MSAPHGTASGPDGQPRPGSSAEHVWQLHPEVEPVAADPGRRELREFFELIGGLRSRTRRQYQAMIPPQLRTRADLVVVALVISMAAITIRSWLRRPPSELPTALQGAWNTTYRNYADRGFWIGRHQVAFQVGPNREDVAVFPVTHLTVERSRGDTTWYTITYAVDGGSNNWSIRQVRLPHPTIVFVHQSQMTWTVTPALHSPAK